MCKKSLFFAAVSVFVSGFLFFSCSSDSSIDLNSGSEETLRMTFSQKNSSTIWAREIESSVLSRKINTSAYISSNLKLEPELYLAAVTEETPVYPSLNGFGSLDSTQLVPEAKQIVEKIAENIIFWNFDESLFEKNSVFSLILFKYDVENGWKEKFGADFPSGEERKFSVYYCGEPFIEEDFISVPLRFKNSKGFVDVRIFIDRSQNFKIAQILVKKWGK